jgi:hypothetical protein
MLENRRYRLPIPAGAQERGPPGPPGKQRDSSRFTAVAHASGLAPCTTRGGPRAGRPRKPL